MEENKEEKMETSEAKCTCRSDLRAFVIALLTAIIIVSLYHFARGYCQMKRQILRRNVCPRQTVVVPCCCCAQPGAPARFGRPFGGPGERRMMPGPEGRRMRDGKFRGKGFPGRPAPAAEKPAPAKPAPAPAPAPAK